MKRLVKQFLAILLAVALTVTSVNVPASAYKEEKKGNLSVTGKEGEVITEDKSWEEEFPNGTFAFKIDKMTISEGETESQKITIYRLGGTAGKAVANIAIAPAVSSLDEEMKDLIYANAASNTDYTVQVENPIEGSEEVTYSDVPLNTEGEYKSTLFDVTFEEGEWVKDILVTPTEDLYPESVEFSTFTIYDCQGAEFTESANRFSFGINDNEEAVPSEMGFEVDHVRVDKSAGKAEVVVKRTGGIQYVASTEYKTVDGTAKEGVDYTKAEGTVSFSGGFDSFTISVDLINDKKESEDDTSFTIELSNPKAGTLKEGATSLRVDLFNTNTAEGDNLSTKLSEQQDVVDATAKTKVAKKAVTENKNEVVVDAVEYTNPEAEYTPLVNGQEEEMTAAQLGSTGELIFKQEDFDFVNSKIWVNSYNALEAQGDLEMEEREEDKTNPYNTVVKKANGFIGKQRSSLYYHIDNLSNFYDKIQWRVECKTEKKYKAADARNHLSGIVGYITSVEKGHGFVPFTKDSGDDGMQNCLNDELVGKRKLFCVKGNEAEKSEPVVFESPNGGYDDLKLMDPSDCYVCFKSALTQWGSYIRDRNNELAVKKLNFRRRYFTNNPKVKIYTADDAEYAIDDQMIQNIKPTISMDIKKGAGAFLDPAAGGAQHLFVGSNLKFAGKEDGSYRLNQVDFMISDLRVASNWAESNNTCSVCLSLSDMQSITPVSKQNFIYAYMSRQQTLTINCKSSMLGTDSPEQKKAKEDRILKSITYTYAPFNGSMTSFVPKAGTKLGDIPRNAVTGINSVFTTENTIENLKSVNLNLDDGTMVLYNNTVYSGNEDIKIVKEDFEKNNIAISIYTPDAVSYERKPEIISQNKVCVYTDENGNGKIETGQNPIAQYKDGTVCMDELLAYKGHSLLLAIDYAVMPGCLVAPPGKDKNATYDIVPSFVTSLSEDLQTKLSEEQKGYRDIASKDGKVKLYGVSNGTITIPIGYDNSPATFNQGTQKYEWSPDWKGNLKTPYNTPGAITIDGSLMPDGYQVPSEQLNPYLGCLHGNETYVLTSRYAQEITSTSMGVFTTRPEPGAQSFTQNQEKKVEGPKTPEDEKKDQPEMTETSPEVELPTINVGLGPISFEMGDGEIGFSVGIPLFSKEKGEDKKNAKELGQSAIDDMKDAMTKGGSKNIFQQLKDQKNKQYGSGGSGTSGSGNGTQGGSSKPFSDKFSVDVAVNMSFVWAYSSVTGKYEFSSAMIAMNVSGSIRLELRFTPCPIFYVYLNAGMSIDMSTGLEVETQRDVFGNVSQEVSWAGLQLEPSIFIEAGVGVGVELAKVEVYLKVTVNAHFTFSAKDPAVVNSFETQAGLGFRAVFLFFSYEMDVIGFKVGYDEEEVSATSNGWSHAWIAAGQELGGSSLNDSEVQGADVTVRGPKNYAKKQQINTPEENAGDDMSAQAFDVDGIDEFQVSGYGSNASAVELGTNLDPASEYQLITVGDKNYVIYTISRKNPATAVDVTQIVLSELATISNGDNEVKGLRNPVDSDSTTPYIVIDKKDGVEDTTGDLNYHANVVGNRIDVTWTSYEEGAYSHVDQGASQDEVLATVSRYMTVKTASYDTTATTGFTNASVIDDTTDKLDFLPTNISSDVQFYTSSSPFSVGEMAQRKLKYQQYYEDSAEGNTDNGVSTGDPYAEADYECAIALDNMYGKFSEPSFLVKQSDGEYEKVLYDLPSKWAENNTRIVDVKTIPIDNDTFYMAINTEEMEITQNEDNEDEMITIKKIYLQKADVVETEGKKTLEFGTRVLFKTLVDYDKTDEKDGEYQNTALVGDGYESPNFAGIKFLNGKLSSNTAENFLLYTMNGTTYVVNEASLTKLMNEDLGDTITIKKLFNEEEGHSTQTDTVIGVDGDGNISAVYGETVASTDNNALYVTKYDPNVGGFGQGFMLAMNHMQVYEDSVAQLWNEEETKDAFMDTTKGGGADRFVFTSPQIALGTPTTNDTNGTLTILTKGTMTKMKKQTVDLGGDSITEYMPDTSSGSMAGTMGVYAITYGIGKQKIGEASISLEKHNLVAGATDNACLTFRNTGDVAIRGSAANPIDLKLMASLKDNPDDKVELAAWEIKSNVLAGQQVSSGYTTTCTMPTDIANRIIYFTVAEDASYITEGAFSASTIDGDEGVAKITVGERAELSFDEETKITIGNEAKITKVNGVDCVVADLDTAIRNAGIKDASDIKIEVEYVTGKNEEGVEQYSPLDFDGVLAYQQDGNALTTNGTNGSYGWKGYVDDLNNFVANTSGKAEKGKNYALRGSINIPLSCFDTTSATKGVSLRLTLKTNEEEYTKDNNNVYVNLIPTTVFTLPDNINLTIGNATSFEVNYVAASVQASNITLTEMRVNESGETVETDTKLLDSASYNPVSGYVTLKAAKIGSGIIRIMDTTTGSFKDVAFTATTQGVNINTENTNLEFTNVQGSKAWEDRKIGEILAGTVLPYENDVCIAGKNNSFTFTTYARSIDLYFDGQIQVSSKNTFGYTDKVYNSTSDKPSAGMYYAPTKIDFGNTNLKKHEVTITVLSTQAKFDKYIEKYSEDGKLEKDIVKDAVNPVIYFGKSIQKFQPGKVQSGVTVQVPVYVYDNMSLNSVLINNIGADNQVSQNYVKSMLTITENGTYKVVAKDASGNKAESTIEVDWFDDGVKAEANVVDAMPIVTKAMLVNESGQPISGYTNSNAYIHFAANAPKNIKSIELYTKNMQTGEETPYGEAVTSSAITATYEDTFETAIMDNGYYVVKVTDMNDCVGYDILNVNNISAGPKVSLFMTRGTNYQQSLFYSIGDEENVVGLSKLVICKGSVDSSSPTEISVPTNKILSTKTYSDGETIDSGVVSLQGCSDTVFTIFGMDEAGKIKKYSFDDKTNLTGIGISANAYNLEFDQPFAPYIHEYTLVLPVGYPEDQTPELIPQYSASDVSVVTSKEDDKIIYTVSSAQNEVKYEVTIKRQICTCGIKLSLTDQSIMIPYEAANVEKAIQKVTTLEKCELAGHENYTLDDIEYSYQVTQGNDYAQVDNEGNVTFTRLPEGVASQNVAIEVTASMATCEKKETVSYKILNQYKIGVETQEGGQITCSGEVMYGAESQENSGTMDMYSGEYLELTAVAKPGYEFVSWVDGDNNTISTEVEISHQVLKDAELIATFKDVTAPYGSISLTDQNDENITETISGSSIQYSTKGFDVTIQSADDHSGMKKVEYQILESDEELDENAEWLTYDEDHVPTVTTDRTFVIYARLTDQDNNTVIIHSNEATVDSQGVALETNTNFTVDSFMNKEDAAIEVEITPNVAGIKEITYVVDGENYTSDTNTFTIEDLPDGEYDVVISVTDKALHQVQNTIKVKKDTVVPEVTVTGNPTTDVESATLTITADGGLSGVKKTTVNQNVVTGNTYKVTENGTYTVEVTDGAGNTTSKVVEVTKIVKPQPPKGGNGTDVTNQKPEQIQAVNTMTVERGKRTKVAYKVLPEAAAQKAVTFSSSNESVATVDARGKITGHRLGTTTIKVVSTVDEKVQSFITVKVTLPKAKAVQVKKVKVKGKKTAVVMWKGINKAKKYEVYRSTKADGKFKKIATVKSSAYVDKKAKLSKKYYYRVAAIASNRKYNAPFSDVVKSFSKLTTQNTESGVVEMNLAQVSSLKLKNKKATIKLNWKSVKKATHYKIFRAESQYGTFEEIAMVEGNTTYTDTLVDKGKKYYYRVRGVKVDDGTVVSMSSKVAKAKIKKK